MQQRERERDVALDAVTAAGRLTATVQAAWQAAREKMDKNDGSPVTVADFAAQAVVNRHLRAAFPDDRIVAEETGASFLAAPAALQRRVVELAGAHNEAEVAALLDHGAGQRPDDGALLPGRCWTLDPVDGTKGFVRGGHYAVALALIENGRAVVAAMACPRQPFATGATTGSVFAAAHRGGTIAAPLDRAIAPARVQTTTTRDVSAARVAESFEASESDPGTYGRLWRTLRVARDPDRLDGQGKYAMVARGEADVYVRLLRGRGIENIWDHAPGVLLVLEAGGRVSDLAGNDLDFSRPAFAPRGGIVATNGALHDAVRAAAAAL